jgi:hypothetical protein
MSAQNYGMFFRFVALHGYLQWQVLRLGILLLPHNQIVNPDHLHFTPSKTTFSQILESGCLNFSR